MVTELVRSLSRKKKVNVCHRVDKTRRNYHLIMEAARLMMVNLSNRLITSISETQTVSQRLSGYLQKPEGAKTASKISKNVETQNSED